MTTKIEDSVRTVAIVLNDNDFGNTFRPLLESIYSAITWNGGMSREAIIASILAGVEFHYVAFQHGSHFGESGYGTTKETVEYLKRVQILFNEDAEADICQYPHDGGAWYLEVQSGNISSY
jgi:hypothetical protein